MVCKDCSASYFLRHPPAFSVPATLALIGHQLVPGMIFLFMPNKHLFVLWISIQVFLFHAILFRSPWLDWPLLFVLIRPRTSLQSTWHNCSFPLVSVIICLSYLPYCILCYRRAVATWVTIVNPLPGTLLELNKYLWNECICMHEKASFIFSVIQSIKESLELRLYQSKSL